VSAEREQRKRKEAPRSPERSAADIIKVLSSITSTGHRPDDIFDDWLILSEATLDMLPTHLKSTLSQGQFAEDPPEIAETWAKTRKKYGDKQWVFERFSEAFGLLLNGAYPFDDDPTYKDIVGETFMEFGRPSKWAGQFFTPWTVAKLLAEMTRGAEEQVHENLKAAIEKSPFAQACAITGLMLEGVETQKWLITRVIPAAIEYYEPVRILDPAVGSGIMLLAHASTMPRWMVTTGLVQYHGVDIDQTCVRMARINCKLYGLNGHHLKYAVDLTAEDLANLPQPHAAAYTEAQVAHEAGNDERVEEIAKEIRGQQMNLFTDI
jgi:N-6 DNA Methylase